nr:hypothetical protein [Pedobacter panaciterrae]
MKKYNTSKFKYTYLFFLICVCGFSSCAQKKEVRSDIEDKLFGSWQGVRKHSPDLQDTIAVAVLIDSANFLLNIGSENERYNFRVFIKDGDTLLERTKAFKGLLNEPSYLKVNFINQNEVRLFFTFKQSEQMYLSDNKSGFYLKKIRSK